MMKRIFALLLCAATLLTSLSFVGCSSEEKEEDKGQYITAYLTDNVYDLDPAHAYTNEALANVVSLMFETLFTLEENGKVKKNLVKEYVIEENESAGEYTMKLYLKDTCWSDGTAISANDIVFAWKRLLEVDANFEAASLLFDIKNARAAKEGDASIDDVGIYPAEQQMLEINFEGKIDYDQFLLNLTSLALAPLRDDIVSKSDDWAKKPGTMVCSGPFKLGRINFTNPEGQFHYDSSYETVDANGFPVIGGNFAEQRVTDFIIERNAYYYRDPEEDKVTKSVTPYRICVDCSLTDEQLLAMYDTGMVMYVSDIPLALRKDSNLAADAVVSEKSMSTNSIYLNQNAFIQDGSEEGFQLFADAKVRQALSMAIDRQAIADAIVYAEVATGLVPTGVFESGDRKVLFRDTCTAVYNTLKTDTTAAKALLDEAGINPSKYTFNLMCAAYDEVHCLIADMIVASWTELGFNVTAQKMSTIVNNDYYKYIDAVPSDICDDLYAENMRAGAFEAVLLDYVAMTPDPFSVLSSFAKPFSGRGMDMSNPEEYKLTPHITGYDSEEYNALMEEIYAEKVIANRAENYRKAEEILMNDMPIIPIVYNLNASVTSKKLAGTDAIYTGTTAFTDAKVRSYDKYLAAGKAYINANFSEMKFTEAKECAYKEFEVFKSSNTIYMHYYLDEAEAAKKSASKK